MKGIFHKIVRIPTIWKPVVFPLLATTVVYLDFAKQATVLNVPNTFPIVHKT